MGIWLVFALHKCNAVFRIEHSYIFVILYSICIHFYPGGPNLAYFLSKAIDFRDRGCFHMCNLDVTLKRP